MYVACVIYLEKYVLEDTCDLTKTALSLWKENLYYAICIKAYTRIVLFIWKIFILI